MVLISHAHLHIYIYTKIQVQWLTICTAIVGCLPDSDLKRKVIRIMLIHCFDFLSNAISAVVHYHNVENRPVNGICVANHTSPIDALVLMCDNCYSLVSQKLNAECLWNALFSSYQLSIVLCDSLHYPSFAHFLLIIFVLFNYVPSILSFACCISPSHSLIP